MRRAVGALALLFALCGVAAIGQNSGGSSGSSEPCTVSTLRLRFATGDDDLRGGQDNLNIVVYFTNGFYQIAGNVNHSQNWPNNSVNMVEIPLERPFPLNEIRALRLVHITDGGFSIKNLPELATPAAPIAIAQAFQSPDNWNMADMQVAAIRNGVGARIASYGFHRFTGSNPDLVITTSIPPNTCESGRIQVPPDTKVLFTRPESALQIEEHRAASNVVPAPGPSGPPLNSGRTELPGAGGGGESGVLTNADVINMLRAGISEENIRTVTPSHRVAFDVQSPQARAEFDRACAAIRPSGVSTSTWATEIRNIWEWMTNVMICQQTNGRGGEDACPPNATPSTPKNTLLAPNAPLKALGKNEYSAVTTERGVTQDKGFSNWAKSSPGGTNSGVVNGGKNADELNPQPYPPKNSTLLSSNSQQTLLGNGGSGTHGSILPAVQRQAITDGTVTGARPMNTFNAGPNQMMNAQGNVAGPPGSHPGSTGNLASTIQPGMIISRVTVPPVAVRGNPNLYVTQQCAANPSPRILFLSGTADGKTLTVGPQYTLWGCSFGNRQLNKSTPPITRSSGTGPINPPTSFYVALLISIKPEFTGFIYGQVRTWSDNAIVFTFPPTAAVNDAGAPLSGPAVPTELWLTRGSNPSMIYGHEGGLYFKPAI